MPTRMPTLYIPHGAGPCFFMDWNPPDAWNKMAAYLRGIANTLAHPPTAIIMVSAHWQEPVFTITSGVAPGLIYDYYGFPEHTYELRYPAPGDPQLADRIMQHLQQVQIKGDQNASRGFDHGMFIPLMLMFPAANIPVVQVSLRNDLDPQAHIDMGAALAPLRDEGVLIVGSGMSFHNMKGYGNPEFGPISDAFDHWLVSVVESSPLHCRQALADWTQAPGARLCHPLQAEEHLLPLMVVAGAAGSDQGKCVFSDRVMETTLSAFSFAA